MTTGEDNGDGSWVAQRMGCSKVKEWVMRLYAQWLCYMTLVVDISFDYGVLKATKVVKDNWCRVPCRLIG